MKVKRDYEGEEILKRVGKETGEDNGISGHTDGQTHTHPRRVTIGEISRTNIKEEGSRG